MHSWLRIGALSLVACLPLVGCATPPEVKQALVAKDEAYAESLRLMHQYRELVDDNAGRIRTIVVGIKARNLYWKAIDAAVHPGVPIAAELGGELIQSVSEVRRQMETERSVAPVLLAAVPKLVRLSLQESERQWKATQQLASDGTAFDRYAAAVAEVRSISAAVQRYLNIDVTVSPDDIKEIAGAIKELHR